MTPNSDTPRMTKNSMWLCRRCAIEDIICYRKSLWCIRIM